MKKIEIKSVFKEYDSKDELSEEDKTLVNLAQDSAKNAYAPYSDFKVGAAVLLENEKIICGNNQENIAFPSGLCAERVAVFSAAAQFPNVIIKSIAVVCLSDKININEPLSPCGACRQSMSEYEVRFSKNIRVILSGQTGKVVIAESIKSLLPLQFYFEGLRKK